MSPSPAPFSAFPEAYRPSYAPWRAFVDHVHDGDTVCVVCDVGFGHYPVVWVRLEGVFAAEMHEHDGPILADQLTQLLPYGTPVLLSTKKQLRSGGQTMTFERYVGRLTMVESNDSSADRDVGVIVNKWISALKG